MTNAAAPRLFNDVQGLAQLRADVARPGGTAPPEAAREAARQFEALFVQMMLKSMRDANAALGAGSDSTYQDMFDQQIALEMTRGRGLGLAEMLARQLELTGTAAGSPAESSSAATTTASRQDFRPGSPAEFVRAVWPHARAVARELNLDPRAIVAQAALETGWGSRQIRDGQGVSGNNLFGIKADSRWAGPRVTVQTLEYDGGIPRLERAAFRAYDSLGAGFADYARFLKDNPRYAEALRNGRDPDRYAEALQAAGYATDPRYAGKIRDILAGPTLKEALAGLPGGAGTQG